MLCSCYEVILSILNQQSNSSMESNDTANTFYNASSSSSSSLASSPSSPPTPPVILSPCAACKILRRRCADKCVLAPYFPPNEPLKFTTAHRVFGASNIIKFLQELPESQRADAVSSMVYEATARIRDPVYGCAGVIFHLQRQVSDLQAELAKDQAELVKMQSQQANLLALICMEMTKSQQLMPQPMEDFFGVDAYFMEDSSQGSVWESTLWT